MKKISYILLIAISIFALNSCENDIKGTEDLNYVTFQKDLPLITVEKNSSTSVEVHVYSTQIQKSDTNFNVIIDPSSTINTEAFSVPSSVTIPSGSNDGIITVTFSDINLSENIETLVLQLEAKQNVFMGGKITLTIQKKCSLSGIQDLVGNYSVTTDNDGYENNISTTANANDLIVNGLGQDFITYFWSETVTAGGSCTMSVDQETGNLVIPRQYIFTTNYNGTLYDYEIEGTGTWGNCGNSPTLTITYDIYYPGDSDGLAKTYSSYLPGPYLNGTFTLN